MSTTSDVVMRNIFLLMLFVIAVGGYAVIGYIAIKGFNSTIDAKQTVSCNLRFPNVNDIDMNPGALGE